MAYQHHGGQYGNQQHQQPVYAEQGYDGYSNSYPPYDAQQHQQQQQEQYDSNRLDDNEKYLQDPAYLHRQHSYAESDADTRVVSLYDEKGVHNNQHHGGAAAIGTAVQPVDSANSNDDDYIPPAIPRPRNANGEFTPGHLSRGSVALMAAAEGKIPKKEGLKMWRSDEHHGVFTAGGRRRAAMRCCCCTLIFAVILIVGIIAAFMLWVGGLFQRVMVL